MCFSTVEEKLTFGHAVSVRVRFIVVERNNNSLLVCNQLHLIVEARN